MDDFSDLTEREKSAARAAFRKAMGDRDTILDSTYIDRFFDQDPGVAAGIRVYEDDEPGKFAAFGADKQADRIKKLYPELFLDGPRQGGTPPRPEPRQASLYWEKLKRLQFQSIDQRRGSAYGSMFARPTLNQTMKRSVSNKRGM